MRLEGHNETCPLVGSARLAVLVEETAPDDVNIEVDMDMDAPAELVITEDTRTTWYLKLAYKKTDSSIAMSCIYVSQSDYIMPANHP